MPQQKKSLRRKVLRSDPVHDPLETKLVNWVRGVVRSKDELVLALGGLQRSYKELLAAQHVTDGEDVLRQVEGALKNAEKSKAMF